LRPNFVTAAPVNTLVLLPGMDGTGELFARFVRALGPGIEARVLRYPVDRPWGYVELLAFVREALPVERPYVLLAESFSGPIGIQVAAQAPPQLQGLVLCCTFASNPRPAMRPFGGLLRALPLGAMPVAPLGRMLMGRDFESALNADLAAAMRQLPAAVVRARLKAVLGVDATAELRRVVAPVLYLRAKEDLVVPRSAGARIAEIKPDVEMAGMPGPHFLLQTRPAEVAAVVKRFMLIATATPGSHAAPADRPGAASAAR
jgi:pimeloyl-ACP methyl ester carboxylesterase